MKLTLYFTPTTCSTAARIALEEAAVPHDAVLIKLYRPEEQERFRAINPKGTVPALGIGDEVLTENVAIMTYIAAINPAAKLMPSDPGTYAQCLSFMAWLASSVQIARRQARAPQRFTDDERAYEGLKASGAQAFWRHLTMIDQRLAGRMWVMGDQFTVADCYAIVFYHWGVIDERPMASLESFSAFKDRMLARPAVRSVLEKERSVLVELLPPLA